MHSRRMTVRKGLIFIMEWLIVADQATALMSGCFGGFCFVSSNLESEWRSRDNAEQWCSSNNGTQLIEVTRADIQLAMSSFLNSINGANLYSGRTLFTAGKREPGSWTWVTKKSANYLYIDTPNDVSYAYAYLQLQTISRSALTASRPTDTKQGYICEYEPQCADTTGVSLNSRCYRSYSNEALSWYDARSRCLDRGGDLASFDFITQNEGLSVLNGSWLTPTNTYWLGLRREWWTWKISQADVKYSYWSAGDHPRTLSNDPSDCLCLEPSQWKWLECRCGETKPLICFSEIRSSSTTTTTTTTTSTTVTTSTTTTPKSTTTPISAVSPTSSPSPSNESVHDVASTISSTNPTENPMLTAPDGSSVPTTAAAVMGQKHKEGLDRDIAIGIGVGVGGGVVVVILVVVVAVIIIRKRSKGSNPEKKEKTKKVKKLQTPDIIALQTTTTTNQEENPYVTVIRLPDIGETSVYENAPSDKPETVYADLEFLTKSSLTDNSSSADVVSETGNSRPSSPSRLAEADVEVDHIDYNADQYTTATCATFL